jgi:hypothetical protein
MKMVLWDGKAIHNSLLAHNTSPGTAMIVHWTKTEFRNVSCDEHFDEMSSSTDQARMIFVVRNKHGRSAEQEGEREGRMKGLGVCSTGCTVIWYTEYSLALEEFYRLSAHI